MRADILVTNFAEPFRGATPIGNNPNPQPPPDDGPWYWAAQSFKTDNTLYRLDTIEVMVGDGSIAPPPVIVAELRADTIGGIGALIATFTTPDVSGPIAAHTFTPATEVHLAPDTHYWFVLGSEVPGDGTFLFAYINTNDSTGNGTVTAYADSDTSGAVWRYNLDFPYYIQVSVTPIADTDGDGVSDDDDACCNTPPGTLVDAQGRPIGDFDLDCDNDLADYAIYTQGFTGPLAGSPECPPAKPAAP